MKRRLELFATALLCAVACSAPAAADDFIVGGSAAPAGSWPSIAYLRGSYHDVEGQVHGFACTGSIVAPQWIVTAAHCTLGEHGEPVEQMTATLGVVDYTDPTAERITVDRLVTDPSYDAGRQVDDAGMVHLAQATSHPVIPLATSDAGRYSSAARVPNAAGWGALDEDGTEFKPTLQQAYLRVRQGDECAGLIEGFDPATQTCAGSPGAAGVCFGDSGGPLVETDAQTGQPALWGVTSYGPQTAVGLAPCSVKLPAVFTWIPAVGDFIRATISPPPAASDPPVSAPPPAPADPPTAAPAVPSADCRRARQAVRRSRTAERRARKRLHAARRHHGATAQRRRTHARRALRTAKVHTHRAHVTAERRCRPR